MARPLPPLVWDRRSGKSFSQLMDDHTHPVSAHWNEGPPNMTVSELIAELRAMPPETTVMLWSRMDDTQHRRGRNRCALLKVVASRRSGHRKA
jgi:hypothetical protein